MSEPEVSVLLTSWNTRDETRRCLESLRVAADGLTYEVVAVDNASRDGSAELLAADPRVHLIRNERNVGFAAAVNQAYREARGELILLLNSDVEIHPPALGLMVTFLRDHPEAAGVSPQYRNPDGSFQQHYVQQPSLAACMALWTPLKRVPGFRGALHRFQMRGEDFSQPRELSSASCMLVRASALGPGRIFDERFPIYWNDALLTLALNAAGHRTWMIPDAVVTHSRGASCQLLGPAIRFRHLLGGMVCYLRLTRPRAHVEVFRAVLVTDYLVKTVLGRTTTLGWRDLLAALRGEVGPLPDGDTRAWEVVVGLLVNETMVGDDRRLLLVDMRGGRHGHHRRRLAVSQTGPSVWHATLPTTFGAGQRLAPVRWLNDRVRAASLRRWLDGHAGQRTLRVDEDYAHLVGRLGEDMMATVEPRQFEPSHG